MIGSGPGGYTAAFRAADLGISVILIEKNTTLGGVCLNRGCIPSKTLLHLSKIIEEAESIKKAGVEFSKPKIDIIKIQSWKNRIIKKLGGIDIFLLASGSSDGHVAFNNAYSKLSQKTHITKLSIKTRKDNMKTFPNFEKLNEVPKYGLTVGLKTIFSLTKKAILVLTGKEKKEAFRKIKELNKFDVNWPASIVFKCRNYNIYTNLLDNYQK